MKNNDKKIKAGAKDAKDVIARVKQKKREKEAAEKEAARSASAKSVITKSKLIGKISGKRLSAKKSSRHRANAVKENKLEMLVTIVNRNKAEYYIDLMHAFDINIQLVTLGHGTADAKTLAYFGATDTDKAVIIGIVQENNIPDLMSTLEEKFNKIKNGKGIAYTVPLTGVIGTLIFGFLSNNRKAVKESENKQ